MAISRGYMRLLKITCVRPTRNFARPKSSSFGPPPVSMMLAGFRSR